MRKSAEEVAHSLIARINGSEKGVFLINGHPHRKIVFDIAREMFEAFRDAAVHEEFVRMSEHCNAAVNEAYERAASKFSCSICINDPCGECASCMVAFKIRRLKSPAPAKELLFSGQCNHHIPIGQPCSECGR